MPDEYLNLDEYPAEHTALCFICFDFKKGVILSLTLRTILTDR